MMSFHDLMEPIFARVGVKLITRNLAHGGLGTLQSALGSGSIYGDEIDMLVWDSGMTEKEDRYIDLFYRQALLAGKRSPFLWDGNFKVLKKLYEEVGADVGQIGTGMDGIEETIDEVQAASLPWASQFLKCNPQNQNMCNDKAHKFRTTCWIERPDVTPPKRQAGAVGGQAGWHPGWRWHQLKGRVMAFTILNALQSAVNQWNLYSISIGAPLDDDYWHVSEMYDEMQKKVRELRYDPSEKLCEEFAEQGAFPERVCTTPLKARSEFTPRANPETTSLRSIIKPTSDGYIPSLKEEMLYTGPDVPIPELEVPDDQIDVKAIIVNRRLQSETLGNESEIKLDDEIELMSHQSLRRRTNNDVFPGSGWSLDTHPGICDGTYDAICGREPSFNCLLSGHMDLRGGIDGDGLSGWLIMNIPEVKEGLIMLKMDTWHDPSSNRATNGWTEENNGVNNKRALKPADFCDDFVFEYSIDGVITSLKKDEFLGKMTNPQRVVEILTVLDDEEMAKEEKKRDIEVGMRLLGCQREKTFRLTHVYWA